MGLGATLALVGLGAFHGLNPGMGWLFAVAIGLQERSRTAMARALLPIAAGHFASITVVAVAVAVGASTWTTRAVAILGGVLLVALGMWQLLSKRHFRWVGMRLNAWQLAGWSFLMASVHGAGLMLVPVLTSGGRSGPSHAPGAPTSTGTGIGGAALNGVLAAGIHTVAMVVVGGLIAFVVYEFLGVAILRTAWINLDGIWAVVLLAAGSITVVVALA
ncbi:hypothetical protein [Actinopolymorpha pittospori]|uniref:Uncharacterized protein n=1 Tax=Actinopolymorpha pittospori TaxID=648752 RepID=A0A927RES3_9ACTN|nr:hypothetical protein [Actinopolymorpha pittospori]MBE1609480.1 hypothetical protein [Actinopolymorpha pittospori]